MRKSEQWDFRNEKEKQISKIYEDRGYIIESGESEYIEEMKKEIEEYLEEFTKKFGEEKRHKLENIHHIISNKKINDLRLYIMQRIRQSTKFKKNYYYGARNIIHGLCGNELAMQKKPGISINLPNNREDILPIHADTWNGVSPYELNIWVPFVNCKKSLCLYILERKKYNERLKDSKKLLTLTSDEIFKELQDDLTWIPVKYGQVLAFDQSLPHGYSLNEENITHWSMNCRFKGLHTPYWDKKLGEYFMPITAKSSTRLGMRYEHPVRWV